MTDDYQAWVTALENLRDYRPNTQEEKRAWDHSGLTWEFSTSGKLYYVICRSCQQEFRFLPDEEPCFPGHTPDEQGCAHTAVVREALAHWREQHEHK